MNLKLSSEATLSDFAYEGLWAKPNLELEKSTLAKVLPKEKPTRTIKNSFEAPRLVVDFAKLVHPADKSQGGSYTNKSSFITWVKGEKTNNVYPVLPGVTYPWSIDGFADPIHHPGQVFKVVDRLHTFYISDKPEPSISFQSNNVFEALTRKEIAQPIIGGWKNQDWQSQLHAKKDFGWDNLFSASQPDFAMRI
ncbi:MAG: hypothetical protein JSR44_11950 [Spirochaetes bacterium]|nr:hypothetical protein [Spirochaetota bacterium]